MSEAGQTGEEKSPPSKRLMIVQTVAGQTIELGRITVTKTDDENAQARIEGVSENTLQKITYLISPETTKGKVSGKKPLGEIVADFKTMIEAEGFHAEELPDGDIQVQFALDMNTGRLIGTQKVMHPYASGPDDLAAKMMSSIKEKFASIPTEIAEKINAAVVVRDHTRAVEELKAAVKEGRLGFAPNAQLLDALASIEVNSFGQENRDLVRDALLRTAQQLDRIDIAAAQAESILAERQNLTDYGRSDLEMIIAHAAAKEGHIETAMTIWRRLLKTPEKMAPESRGWALRNISLALDIQDPEALRTARRSSDAFLEAGNKAEAGKSLMRVSKALMYESPQKAIDALDAIEAVANQEGLQQNEMLSALYHARANRLSALGDHGSALGEAKKAVELKRALVGLETGLISSLYLVEQELKALGQLEEAAAYGEEAAHLIEKTDDAYFKLASRVTALSNNFNQTEADAILAEAIAAKKDEIIAGIQTLIATLAPDLSDTQRLSKLEACLREQDQKKLPEVAKAPARHALATQLIKLGQLDRAEPWLRKLLAANPIDRWARDAMIDILWRQEKWGDATIFLRKQIQIYGDRPGFTFALGKSLLKSGALDDAVSVLHRSANLATSNPEIKKAAQELRDKALDMGGTIRPVEDETSQNAPLSSELFETALQEFCRFISADKRMTFWVKDEKDDYVWMPSPEGYAQSLLHTYLKGKFGERISVFEEIKTGAGRIDIYVQLTGGLSVAVELKMCGFRYSTTYAAAGEDQVLHYMENKRTSLGYLVVFDARLDHNGEKIMPERQADKYTVKERTCDVRPRFGKRAKNT
jgi:tetratricopeptide (TPR) repeat protein